MDRWWYHEISIWDIPPRDIADCYTRKMEVYELCLDWDKVYEKYYNDEDTVLTFRKAISMSLQDRNEDPLKCRNPNNDNTVKLKKAEAKAKADERRRRIQAEQDAQASQQQSCTYVETLNPNGTTYYRKVCN